MHALFSFPVPLKRSFELGFYVTLSVPESAVPETFFPAAKASKSNKWNIEGDIRLFDWDLQLNQFPIYSAN